MGHVQGDSSVLFQDASYVLPSTIAPLVSAARAQGWTISAEVAPHALERLYLTLTAETANGKGYVYLVWDQKGRRYDVSYAAVTKLCDVTLGGTDYRGVGRSKVDNARYMILANPAIRGEDPSRQVEPEMVETEDDISDPNTPAGRQAWSVVRLSRDAQKYAGQAEEHAKEAERLALETACYADISEVSRTARACREQISEAKRHADLIRPEFEAAERLYRRARWAHAAAYRISSVMFFSDGPWDAVMDDWTERSSDAHASAMEYRDRAEGAIQDAGEDVRRAERQLDRACAVCGTWYPCTRAGRELTADLYDRGGYTCGCGGAVEDVEESAEPGPGQMSFDDVPEPVAPQHVTTVTELDGFHVITCSCGWTHDIDVFTREEDARGRAGMHRRQPHFDAERMAEGPCEQLQKITREIDGTEFVAKWETRQYVIRWHAAALQVGKTAGEAFRRLRAGLKDDPAQFARLMGTETTTNQAEEKTVGRSSLAPKKVVAKVKVGDIVFGDKSRFPCVAEILGHRYVVRKLAGLFEAQHEHSDGARLVFEGEDKNNRCRTGGDMFPNLPALKRAILADAMARGEVVAEEQPDPVAEERKAVTHADLFAVDGEELVRLLESLPEEQREELAAPWPVRWLYPAEKPRGLNLCSGCGGGCKGKRLVSDTDMVCIDLAGNAAASSEAAGCTVLRADVKTLSPEHPALRWTVDAMFTMPCPDFTIAGTGAGRAAENLEILIEAINQVGYMFGNYERDGTEYCTHEEDGEECTWEEGCFSSYGERTDHTVADMWALVEGMTAKTAGLMLAPVIWVLGLRYIGAPLTRIVIEQAAALPEQLKEDIWLELVTAGCEMAEWDTVDAADFGSPSNRKRSILAAHWYRRPGLPVAPGITTLAHEAIGWEPDAEINTRGDRKTSGGNVFRMDGRTSRHPEPKPINGITSKIRGWYNAATGRRFTIEEVCLLVGLPADYPVTGARSSQTQQLGDIFSPLVSLAVWGQLLGVPWREMLRRYLAELYPAVHGQTEDPADVEPVAVFIVSAKSNPTRRRVLWGMTRADAMKLCSDDRTSSDRYMLCWTAPEHLGVLGDDWEWTKDRGTTDAVIAELGVSILDRAVLEAAAEDAEIPQTHAGESVEVEEQVSEPADTEETAPEWSYETERNPRAGCGSFPKPCIHAWPCGRDVVAWSKAQARERMEQARNTPGARLTEGESVTYAGASDDGYGHNFEDMAYDWEIAEGRFRTKSNDLGDKHRHHGESPKGNNGWTISVRCLHETCKGKVFKSVICDSEAVLAMRDHGRKKHPAAVAPKAGEPGFMKALLEKHVGPDWKPLEATADPEFVEVEEEQPQHQGPLTRDERRAAWRIAAGEEIAQPHAGESVEVSDRADTEGKAVLPSAGRGVWEVGSRVLHQGRAGRVVSAKIGTTIVLMDGAEPGHLEHLEPRELVAENYLVCGTLVQLSVPRRAVALEEPQAPVCEALETYVVPELPALVICGEPVALVVPKRVVDPRIAWAQYERPAPVDPRLAWMAYEQPEPVDVLAELRAELEAIRADVDTWGAEVAALAVEEAERIVREVVADMRAAEVLALREEARELRESLGWGPVRWEPVPVRRRGGWAVAASVAGVLAGVGAVLGQVGSPRG
ncbi:hypothetical protein [Streptomyces sp. NPDC058157]|uniref:hypothetical protein n=1 Tax=Streptomyces sp. NPDC058157 TaxID=3346360 RepID=UPI0036EF20F0